MASIRRFLQLGAQEQLLTIAAVCFVCLAHLLIRLVPYRRWASLMCARPHDGANARVPPESVGRAVARSARFVPRSRCLVQAIAAQLLLRLAGCRSQLVIGVATPVKGTLRAHAWVTASDGVVVIGAVPDLQEYVPFDAPSLLVRQL